MINYLVPEKYRVFDPHRPPGPNNPGGGVASKVYRVNEAANHRWFTELISDAAEVDAPVVLIEPLWFVMSNQTSDECLEAINNLKAIKIFYGTELSLLKWPNRFRDAVLETVDAVTVCCNHQREVFRYFGCHDVATLCDPVPENLFAPAMTKQKQLVCTGKIGWQKNTESVIELFDTLKGEIETIYVGSANMWGETPSALNAKLEAELRAVTTQFIPNATLIEMAHILNQATFFGHVAYHDTNSESQLEASLAGCITVALHHPAINGRSSYTGYTHIADMADAICRLDRTEIEQASDAARGWGLDNCSYAAFLDQLETVIRNVGESTR